MSFPSFRASMKHHNNGCTPPPPRIIWEDCQCTQRMADGHGLRAAGS